MKDVAMLALTGALTWGMWRWLDAYGDMVACWAVAWGMWVCKELGA